MKNLTDDELLAELTRRFDENKKTLESMKVLNDKIILVNKKLKESETLKSNFLSNIKNEINNPLSAILGTSDMLINNDGSIDQGNVSKLVKNIYTEVFELDLQLKNIFAAAEFEAGEAYLSVSQVNVDASISSLIGAFANRVKERDITVSFLPLAESEEDDCFVTDPERLHLAVFNLLSNAIKYSNEGGDVAVKVWREEGNLNVSVEDHGIGIDESEQKKIFDRFKQLDSGRTKTHMGHGLGAAVTSAAMDLLNGKISIKSQKGKGSTFTMSIPEAESSDGVDGSSGDSNELFFDDDDDDEGEMF